MIDPIADFRGKPAKIMRELVRQLAKGPPAEDKQALIDALYVIGEAVGLTYDQITTACREGANWGNAERETR